MLTYYVMTNLTIHYCCNLLLNKKINCIIIYIIEYILYIYVLYIYNMFKKKIKYEDIKEIKK